MAKITWTAHTKLQDQDHKFFGVLDWFKYDRSYRLHLSNGKIAMVPIDKTVIIQD